MKGSVMDRALNDRTREMAIRVIKMYDSLPARGAARVIGNQVLRSGTSVGAHLREGYRSRSDAEVISKLEVALQELDETAYWMELIVGAGIVTKRRLSALMKEVDELTAIFVTSVKTIKSRRK